jgi:hypothetical protein
MSKVSVSDAVEAAILYEQTIVLMLADLDAEWCAATRNVTHRPPRRTLINIRRYRTEMFE